MAPPTDGRANSSLDLGTGPSTRDELLPPAPLPPGQVADLFATLDKAIRSQRLYQPNNPMYRGFIAAAQAAFQRIWPEVPLLTAAVEENGFRWYGRAFNAGEGRDSLPYLFHKDGVRFVTFLPGFEDEVEKFLDVVNSARAQDNRTDDDMVTLLWQHEFEFFRYSYVDAMAEGLTIPQSTIPKLAGVELTLVQDEGSAARGQVQGSSTEQQPLTGLINRDDFEETLYFLEPTDLARLHDEVELEWHRDLKRDVLNALFDRLEDGLTLWRPEILRILRQMLPLFLGGGDLASATRILVELNAILDSGKLEAEDRDEAARLFRELSEPAVLSQLMRSLEHGAIDPTGAELGIFLKHLGPGAMPVLLAAIERTDAGPLQDRLRASIEGLATANRAELVTLLSRPDPDVVRGAARLTGQLRIAEAAGPLAKLMTGPDPVLRRTAVEALVGIRNAPALEALQRALSDADREVRIAAARGLASVRYPPARPRLEELLESRIVRDADLTEKIAFFEAFGSVATAESVNMLDRMLNGRRLLGREAPEMRACAAMALGRVDSPAARAALERAAAENNPIVRNAVQRALRRERA